MTRVIAPSRLHFGLIAVPQPGSPPHGRAFGGVGLMIDRPGLAVCVRAADSWAFSGPLANRAQLFAERFLDGIPAAQRRPLHVQVESCPHEHSGLGVGTQLGLAVARAMAAEYGLERWSAVDAAPRIGRGERSAIGVHGFDTGGLIVEPGKLAGEAISPLLMRIALPAAWRVLLFSPPGHGAWHGSREQDAFARSHFADAERLAEALSRLVLCELAPAALAGDLARFGAAVHEFNRRAGEPFATAQGGIYASQAADELIADLRSAGLHGVGQSSWGPTIFAFATDEGAGCAAVQRWNGVVPVQMCCASSGASIQRE